MNLPAAPTPDRLLRQHHRWLGWAWPLAVAAVGLAATLVLNWRRHPTLARVEQWHDLPRWWLAGVVSTALLAAAAWRWRRRDPLRSAQRLDERFDAKNRLETSTVLRHDAGALADAQRQEAVAFLERRALAPAARGTPLLLLCAAVAVLVLAHLVTLVSWTRPWLERAAAVAPAPSPAAPPTAPSLPQARIRWKSPASETKAAPVEEVPLLAAASSTTGLQDLTLEMAVNGQPRLSVPVPADELRVAGEHPVAASVYLDQLAVEPFDVVSYYLRARRVDSRPLPETVSSVQFVQVKPFRSDIREARGGEGYAGFALVTALKVAQLRLIKENFVLAHAELSREDTAWKKEDARVGSEQGALEKKTAEAVAQLIEDKVPAEVINLLTQAEPMMAEASQRILAAANDPALTPQGKALGLITEVEKFGVKLAARDGKTHGNKPNVNDPFKDKQQFELKQRFKTAAGELETLAAAQAQVADELAASDPAPAPTPAPPAKPPDPDKIEGTLPERQTQISQRVGALLNGRVFNQEITRHLEQARDGARESLGHLDAQDPAAAREPAASAARELRLAVDAVDRAGEEEAKLQLADAQSALNEAADQARDAARQTDEKAARQRAEEAERRARQAAEDLAAHAREQQETGSANAAKRLGELAKAVSADDLRRSLEGLRAQPRNPERAQAAADRLQALADRAAQASYPGAPSPEALARLIDRLERARTNMQRLAANDSTPKPDATRQEQTSVGQDRTGQEPAGAPGDPKADPSDRQGSPGKDAADQPPQTGGPRGQGQSQQPGPQGQQSQGQQPGPQGEQQGQRQGQQPSLQGQQGQGQRGQGQNPHARGSQPGQAPGQPTNQEGESRDPGRTTGKNTSRAGQTTAQNGGGRGGRGSRVNDGPTPNGENPPPDLTGAHRPAKGSSTSAPGADDPGPVVDAELGDTYGTSVGETRSGPVPTASGVPRKPTYTDHAPRPAQTRDPAQAREEFARELFQDVREATQEATAFVPKSPALTEVREALRDAPLELHFLDREALFAKIDPPLLGLINSLRAEVQGLARRRHRLADPNLEQALPAYRAAVADYFEQLSRDYDAAPPATPQE